MKNLPHKIRAFFWRWHKRVGLLLAIPLIPIIFSGFLLNHTSQLQLSQSSIRQPLLLDYYGMSLPKLNAANIDDALVVGDSNYNVYLDDKLITQCRGKLVGIAPWQTGFVIGCQEELLLVSDAGDVQERINHSLGLPVPVSMIATCDQRVCTTSQKQNYRVDIENLKWTPVSDQQTWQVSNLYQLPHKQLTSIKTELSLEQLLHDIHSGSILGSLGVFLVDLAGLFILFLALLCC